MEAGNQLGHWQDSTAINYSTVNLNAYPSLPPSIKQEKRFLNEFQTHLLGGEHPQWVSWLTVSREAGLVTLFMQLLTDREILKAKANVEEHKKPGYLQQDLISQQRL